MINNNLARALLIIFAFFAQYSHAADKIKINIKFHCNGSTWKNVFIDKYCSYKVEADGTKTPIRAKKPHFGIFEVKFVGNKFEIVETIWGNPPKSNAFDIKLLHNIRMVYSKEEVMENYFRLPRLDAPIKWHHKKEDDFLEVVHQASLDKKELKKLRRVKDLSESHFIIIAYYTNDGNWGFHSQTICDFLLVENNKVYAPAFLKTTKPMETWVYHPLVSELSAYKQMLIEKASSTIEQRPAECEIYSKTKN